MLDKDAINRRLETGFDPSLTGPYTKTRLYQYVLY